MAKFTTNTSRDYYGVLTVTEDSQSIPKNTTTVKYVLKMYSGGWNFAQHSVGYNVYINGVRVAYHDNSNNHKTLDFNSSITLCSGTAKVPHNADGTKTLSVSCKIWMDTSYSYLPATSLSKSGTMKLTTIPRVSDLALDVDTVLADGESKVVVTVEKKADDFTDVLTVSLGDFIQEFSEEEFEDAETGKTVAFTIPMDWIKAIPTTSAVAKVTVETFSGETSIGTKSVDLTVTVPDEVVPIIKSISISEAVEAVANAFEGLHLQNMSQLNIVVEAEGVFGSEVSAAGYSVNIDGVNYKQQVITTNTLHTFGKLIGTVNVTDSRGRTKTETFEVEVIEYNKPMVALTNYYHWNADDNQQDSDGTSTKVLIDYKVYRVEDLNTRSLVLYYSSTTDESPREQIVTLNSWEGTAEVIIPDTDPTVTYEYKAVLKDALVTDDSIYSLLKTGKVVMSRKAGGDGVTFFKEASQAGLWVKDMRYDMTSEELNALALLGGAKKLIDWIYPIGSVIASTNPAFNPNNIYTHQTWERFAKGKTLVGVDESDDDFASAGLELGEKEHTLTTDEMPKHRHALNGVGVTRDASGYNAARSYTFSSLDDTGHTSYVGSSAAHNNIQPSVTVYYWQRVAIKTQVLGSGKLGEIILG